MAQLNDLLVLGYTNLLGTVNAFGEIIATKFIGDGSSITNISVGNINGTIPVTQGGTGKTSWTPYGIVYASAAGVLGQLPIGDQYYVLQSQGSGKAPIWIRSTSEAVESTIVRRNSSGNFSAGTITANLSGLASSASSARISLTEPSSGTWYENVFVKGHTSGEDYSLRAHDGFRHYVLQGTDAALGHSILAVGNAKSGVDTFEAGNKKGRLRIYSGKKGYADIYATDSDSNSTHYLPGSGGTLLNEKTLTWGNTDSTIASIGQLTINGTVNTLYDTFLYRRGTSLADNAITDINTIKEPSVYYSNASAESANLTNAPITTAGFRLITIAGYQGSADYGSQMAFSSSGRVFWRSMGNSNGSPSDWYMWVKFKRGTAMGSATKSFYLTDDGVPTEGKTYAGGTKVTLNSTDKGEDTASFFAPTTAGTANNVLTSQGAGAPLWKDTIKVKSITLTSTTNGSQTAASSPAIRIGDSDTAIHIIIDRNAINAKTTSTTAGTLSINESGGLVKIGPDGLKVNKITSDQAFSLTTTGTNTFTSSSTLYLERGVNSSIIFRKGPDTENARFDTDGHFKPGATETYSLGTSSYNWNNVYAKGFVQGGYNLNRLYVSLVPAGTSIPANADLKTTTYLKVGNYTCSANATAKTLKNCPVSNAFLLQVYSPLSATIDNETTATYIYRIRKIIEYSTGIEFIQFVSSGSTAGTFTYGDWKMVPHAVVALDSTDTNGVTRTKGGTTSPIYINSDGLFAVGNTYAGGTAVTLNGSSKASSTASFYAPTSKGTQNYLLIGNSSGVPAWSELIPDAALPLRLRAAQSSGFADANEAVETGFHYMTTTGTNRPSFSQSTNKDYRILTTAYGSTWLQQIATDFRCNDIFYRRKENNVWQSWVQIQTTESADARYAKLQTWNNLIHSGNEFTFVPGSYSGEVWFNYRTASGSTDGNITGYRFGNGKTGTAVTLYADAFSGNASSASLLIANSTSLTSTTVDSALESSPSLKINKGDNTIYNTNDGLILTASWSSSYGAQLWLDDGGGEGGMAIRNRNASGWNPWRQFITSANIGSQSVASAGTADQLSTSIVFPNANSPFTPETVRSKIGNGSRIKKATWSYDGNGYVAKGSTAKTQCPYFAIDLAGVTVIQTAHSANLFTQLYITAPTTSGVTNAATNEMVFYNYHGDSYSPSWTRVLTDRNFNSYAPKLDGTGASGTWGIGISGNAATASYLTNITSTDLASSSAIQRYVFISYNDLTTNRPAYDTNFTYQTSTGTLSTPKIKISGISAPTSSGGTTYGSGTSGQVLKSNGSGGVYWTSDNNVPGIKSATAVGTLGWGTNNNYVPDISLLAYWNGAYSGTSSNLAYCAKGAFGTVVTKDYIDSSSASAIGTGTSIPTERDIYYGLPTINSAHNYTSSTNIWVPTSAGSAGQVLLSTGDIPGWSNLYYTTRTSTGQTTPGTITELNVYGTAYGNDNVVTAGRLSNGDPGPQIRFGTAKASGQSVSLVFSHYDNVSGGGGASLHLVSSESTAAFIAPMLKAHSVLACQNYGTSAPTTSTTGATIAGSIYFQIVS